MKHLLIFILFNISICNLYSQVENPIQGFQIDSNENNVDLSEDMKLPEINKPNFYQNEKNNKYSELGKTEKELLDMNMDDGLLDNRTSKAPKYFTQDAEITAEVGGDQYLGDFKTSSGFVNVLYRDHQYVDSDMIRVFVNDDIVRSRVYLGSGFEGFTLPLESGFNRIDFLALNQGTSGPNTAELHVYDDTGKLVSAYQWNLLTGDKATVIIVKE